MDISQFQNKALVRKTPIRDYRLENAPAMAVQLPRKFSLRDKIGKVKNQGKSGSCVAQATASYVQLLNFIETGQQVEMSARDVYSLIYQPGGGAYVKDAFQKICNSGCIKEADLPSYENGNPPSEEFMRGRADATPQEQETGMTYLAKKYVTWDNRNTELYKRAISEGNGMVTASWGNNPCWTTKTGIIDIPDVASQMAWRHGVIFIGFFTISDADDDLVKRGLMTMDEARERYDNGISV